MRIAETAFAAFGDEHDLARAGHVADGRPGLLIEDRGAHRDSNVERLPVGAGLFATAAIGSILCPVARRETEVDQGVQRGIADEVDGPAVATIAAIGTTARQVAAAQETQRAIARRCPRKPR